MKSVMGYTGPLRVEWVQKTLFQGVGMKKRPRNGLVVKERKWSWEIKS